MRPHGISSKRAQEASTTARPDIMMTSSSQGAIGFFPFGLRSATGSITTQLLTSRQRRGSAVPPSSPCRDRVGRASYHCTDGDRSGRSPTSQQGRRLGPPALPPHPPRSQNRSRNPTPPLQISPHLPWYRSHLRLQILNVSCRWDHYNSPTITGTGSSRAELLVIRPPPLGAPRPRPPRLDPPRPRPLPRVGGAAFLALPGLPMIEMRGCLWNVSSCCR